MNGSSAQAEIRKREREMAKLKEVERRIAAEREREIAMGKDTLGEAGDQRAQVHTFNHRCE